MVEAHDLSSPSLRLHLSPEELLRVHCVAVMRARDVRIPPWNSRPYAPFAEAAQEEPKTLMGTDLFGMIGDALQHALGKSYLLFLAHLFKPLEDLVGALL
jgi:hypothetical protein